MDCIVFYLPLRVCPRFSLKNRYKPAVWNSFLISNAVNIVHPYLWQTVTKLGWMWMPFGSRETELFAHHRCVICIPLVVAYRAPHTKMINFNIALEINLFARDVSTPRKYSSRLSLVSKYSLAILRFILRLLHQLWSD